MQVAPSLETWAAQEMQNTKLPDKRYLKNLTQMFIQLASKTGQSFSSACGSALRKSAHRLFSEDGLDIQSGHIEKTVSRCKDQSRVLVLEDTTDISYPGRTYPGEKLLWQAIQQVNTMKAGFMLSQNYGTG